MGVDDDLLSPIRASTNAIRAAIRDGTGYQQYLARIGHRKSWSGEGAEILGDTNEEQGQKAGWRSSYTSAPDIGLRSPIGAHEALSSVRSGQDVHAPSMSRRSEGGSSDSHAETETAAEARWSSRSNSGSQFGITPRASRAGDLLPSESHELVNGEVGGAGRRVSRQLSYNNLGKERTSRGTASGLRRPSATSSDSHRSPLAPSAKSQIPDTKNPSRPHSPTSSVGSTASFKSSSQVLSPSPGGKLGTGSAKNLLKTPTRTTSRISSGTDGRQNQLLKPGFKTPGTLDASSSPMHSTTPTRSLTRFGSSQNLNMDRKKAMSMYDSAGLAGPKLSTAPLPRTRPTTVSSPPSGLQVASPTPSFGFGLRPRASASMLRSPGSTSSPTMSSIKSPSSFGYSKPGSSSIPMSRNEVSAPADEFGFKRSSALFSTKSLPVLQQKRT